MHQSNSTTYPYPPNPNPNPNPNFSDNQIIHPPQTYASAPPFTTSDYSSYPSIYPPSNLNSFTSHGYPVQTFPPHSYAVPQHLHQPTSEYPIAEPAFATPDPGPNSFPLPAYPHLRPPADQASSPHRSPSGYPHDPDVNPDRPGGYADGAASGFGWRSRSAMAPELNGPWDRGADDSAAVYSYDGPKAVPSPYPMFDDYGRSVTVPPRHGVPPMPAKIVRAAPKVETEQDVGCGIQKFRVKVLGEGGGQTTMDVLCQVGLDGIRMLDPGSGLTLRIYPLDNITRCQVMDSSTIVFWSKSSVDVEPRRIRLQSNSHTTNTLLDTVTAATVQLKEMGGRNQHAEPTETLEQSGTRKKSFGDWMNRLKPANEERDHWVPDEVVTKCTSCGTDFSAFVRRHHCRNCGDIFCDKCTHGRIALTAEENTVPVRVCDRCMAEATRRLSNAKDSVNKPTGLQSHGDLAKKLQEEMEKNHRASSGGAGKSDASAGGRRMKEVACPTCTVHLQVQAPSVGSETIECGVCQHPFLVSSH